MGCDIHCAIERKTNDEDKNWAYWERVCLYKVNKYDHQIEIVNPYDERSYNLFGLLANVRTEDLEPLCDPRGVPEDVSDNVQQDLDSWGTDIHSHTWFDIQELLLYQQHFKNSPEYECFNHFVDRITAYLDMSGEFTWRGMPTGKYRIIIWFDS